jgi:hypothetical protein
MNTRVARFFEDLLTHRIAIICPRVFELT